MVFLQEKSSQQSSRNIVLQDAEYDAVRKLTVISIQEMKREFRMILQQNKSRSENDVTTRKNPDSSLGIYLTAAKLA